MKERGAKPGKRGRPSKQGRGLPLTDYLAKDPNANVQVYLYVKAQIAAGKGKEQAVGCAVERFERDRTTIQRKIAPFFKNESAMRDVRRYYIESVASARADAERFIKSERVLRASASEELRSLHARLALFYAKDEMRQFDNLTLPLALKLASEREELERFRRRGYHRSSRKSAADKSGR